VTEHEMTTVRTFKGHGRVECSCGETVEENYRSDLSDADKATEVVQKWQRHVAFEGSLRVADQ
jgi:hypothetical protein